MYEHMLENYWVYFEGLPEPVFYEHYYPMGAKEGPYGSSLWDEFNYGRGLKRDKDPDETHFKRFPDQYDTDLRRLLNTVMADSKGMRRGVVVIPASTRGEVNRVTELTRRVLASNPRMFADLTRTVTRSRTKSKAHAGGSRSYTEGFDTICVSRDAGLGQYDVILVIDDILTTGTSFRAMDDKLRASGFAGTIVNFAFANTYPSEGAVCCAEWEQADSEVARERKARASRNASRPIEGLVFDLDQTLIDDAVRDADAEARTIAGKPAGGGPCYRLYDGVRELAGLYIPYAIVSNRPEREMAALLLDSGIEEALYPIDRSSDLSRERYRAYRRRDGARASSTLPNNAFSFPTEDSGGYTVRYYKPSPRGVANALGYLRRGLLGGRNDARVIGLGNTYEDVVAYGTAGIESALALWGVPDAMKEYARGNWGADFVFDSARDFAEWVKERIAYCEMAQKAEETDPDRAREYYELAVRFGDDVMVAAFRLARMYHCSDPARAIPLYEAAIDAGDEYASTNNLGLLVQDDDPERAMALFERAIAAGEEEHATLNLARLIGAGDAPRAVELLERAAAAGNGGTLASDLEPLIRGGSEEAAALYEKEVVSKDGKMANTLAIWVEDHDPERAASLYRRAIAAGDECHATRNLALLLRDDDPETALTMLDRAAEAGNSENLAADLEPMVRSGVEGAVALYERRIVTPDEKRAFDLAQMVSANDPENAKALYERAIAAGDERYATYNLGAMLMNDDPERAKGLFRRAMDAGSEQLATNALGVMVSASSPAQAQELFERSIAAGDEYYATVNLARMLRDEEPKRAAELFRRAAKAGRKDLDGDLRPLVEAGLPEAADLYEAVVVAENPHLANDLANMIKASQPKKARQLYERAIAAGEEYHAPNNLGYLVKDEEPEHAAELFERSIAAGNVVMAANNLGILVAAHDTGRASELFQQAIDAGDDRYATCNLAHLRAASDPDGATALYERSASFGETEALIGLAYLIRESDPERSIELIAKAKEAGNRTESTRFLLKLMGYADGNAAMNAARFLCAAGLDEARDEFIALALGRDRMSPEGTVLLGTSHDNGHPLEWLIVESGPDNILLLSKCSVRTMPFCESAASASWEESEVRRWLNSEFAETWLDPETVGMLVPHGATGDLVFCMSAAELDTLLMGNRPLPACRDISTSLSTDWWIRPDEGGTMSAPYVTKDGDRKWCLAFSAQGVRPAIEIRVDDMPRI